MTFRFRPALWAVLCCTCLLLAAACSREENSRWEKKVSAASIPVLEPNAGLPAQLKLPPPTFQDVRRTVARIYGDALDLADASSAFVIGDFNGDRSDDLAVEVRPAAHRIATLNEATANWIVEDPKQIFVPDLSQKVQRLPPKPPRPIVRAGEPLLVIVHGFGPQGWREPMAQQTYLLRNAGGRKLQLATKEEILAKGAQEAIILFGDLIRTKRSEREQLLFWTGGHYAWFRAAGVSNQ